MCSALHHTAVSRLINGSNSDSDAILGLSENDNPQTKGKKRSKLNPSNTDVIQSTALKKLQTAPRGSIGIPAIRALLARSGSLLKFTAAFRETNSGFWKAGRSVSSSAAHKTLKAKGRKECTGNCHPSYMRMMNLKSWYNRRPSPPVKEKKLKVAVIIFLHKGVVSVS